MNGLHQKHWLHVLQGFLLDAGLFFGAFVLGMRLRFGDNWEGAFSMTWHGVAFGSLLVPCFLYILGLYGRRIAYNPAPRIVFKITLAMTVAVAALVLLFYFDFSSRIGRGVMFLGATLAYGAHLAHHLVRRRRSERIRERVAVLVGGPDADFEIYRLPEFLAPSFEFVGVFAPAGAPPPPGLEVLGTPEQMLEVCTRQRIERVLCPATDLADPARYSQFCRLRYAGINVLPLVAFFEEVHNFIPLELVTPDWLLSASATPEMFYIKKLKRAFDIAVSLVGLVVLGPVLLLGMLAVRITSPGPIFYRQVRTGRFGRTFEVYKLRSMRVDAEARGAVWSVAKGRDPRVTPVGGFLRKYRIDEIPQIFNVLRGEMSFVGPRPERPQFVAELDAQIPYNGERLMIQPGITGWAQVNYPYGASLADARRKLEYDLFYLKHMSVFLDLFILLDTVRIVLRGGVADAGDRTRSVLRSGPASAAPFPDGSPQPSPRG